jgi:hypothetical protein
MIGTFLILSKHCFTWRLLRNSKLRKLSKHVRVKNSIFLNITSCSPLKFNECFRGIYRLHLQGRWIIRARHQNEAVSKEKRNNFCIYSFTMKWRIEYTLHTFDPSQIYLKTNDNIFRIKNSDVCFENTTAYFLNGFISAFIPSYSSSFPRDFTWSPSGPC